VRLASAELASALEAGGLPVSASAWEGWEDGKLFAGAVERDRVSFRAGVRLMDLAAAAQAWELGGESRALDDLTGRLREAGVAGQLETDLDAAREALADGDARALARAVERLERASESALDPFYLAFGKWAEAGRLAAESGKAKLFRSPAFSDFQDKLRERNLPGPVGEALHAVDEVLRGGAESSGELDELATRFEILIGRAG
jgi:hypothetical protein